MCNFYLKQEMKIMTLQMQTDLFEKSVVFRPC